MVNLIYVFYRSGKCESQQVEKWAFMEMETPGDYSKFRRRVQAKSSIALSRSLARFNENKSYKTAENLRNRRLKRSQMVTLNPIALNDSIAAPTNHPEKHPFYSLIFLNSEGKANMYINEGIILSDINWTDLLGVSNGQGLKQMFATYGDYDDSDTNSKVFFTKNSTKPNKKVFHLIFFRIE